MHWGFPLSFLLQVLSLSSLGVRAQSSAVDAYLASETPIAKASLLANIGPDGSKAQGAKAGIVVASSSTSNPNYLFTWTRDSAIAFQSLIDQYISGPDASLRNRIDDYVSAQKVIQQLSNPLGVVNSDGLGQPWFYVYENDFTLMVSGISKYFMKLMGAASSVVPQRDGPALRANALITWANFLVTQNNNSYVSNTLWPVIQLDLDYLAANWNKSGSDLWGVTSSSSFFTTAVQHRALRQGAALATTIGKTAVASTYTTQATNVLCSLQSFWVSGNITANKGGGTSSNDANTVLASIHTFDADAGCDNVTFQPCSDRALANLLSYVNAFRTYAINSGASATQGVATGRYPGDNYFGGNPWYLTTLAAAEQLYDALIVWKKQGSIDVTAISQPFFASLSPGVAVGTYQSSSTTFTTLITAVTNYADSFIAVVAKYTPSGGALAQQYSGSNGAPTGAADLSWSYAALLTAATARKGVASKGWGAKGLTAASTCQGGTTPSGGGGLVPMTFNVQATTVFGENVYVAGSIPELGSWIPDSALLLSAAAYPTWNLTVKLPSNTAIDYKYLRKFNGAVTWEIDPNRHFTTPASAASTVFDMWQSGGVTSTTSAAVTFNVQATTTLGEEIYVVGSVPALGSWSPDSAILLSADSYPTWNVTVKLPSNTGVDYKYIRKFNGVVTWEIDPNRHFTTPASGSSNKLFDVWRS